MNPKTVEELEKELNEINAQRTALKEKAVAVQVMLDEANAKVSLNRKLDNLNQAEKEQLAQLIAAKGIQSTAVVGTPGA